MAYKEGALVIPRPFKLRLEFNAASGKKVCFFLRLFLFYIILNNFFHSFHFSHFPHPYPLHHHFLITAPTNFANYPVKISAEPSHPTTPLSHPQHHYHTPQPHSNSSTSG